MSTHLIHIGSISSRQTYCRAHRPHSASGSRNLTVRRAAPASSPTRRQQRRAAVLFGVVSWALCSAGTILAVGIFA